MPWWGWALIVPSIFVVWAAAMIWLLRRMEEQKRELLIPVPEATARPPEKGIQIQVKARAEAAPGPSAKDEPREVDDLRRIEGIGPKIAAALQEAGITTFAQLAEMEPPVLLEIVKQAGIRLAFPDTWPEQAALAAADQWAALEELQSQFKGGRRI
jgi:predicted flap endonuclease-1-like 5' DNA nuclease